MGLSVIELRRPTSFESFGCRESFPLSTIDNLIYSTAFCVFMSSQLKSPFFSLKKKKNHPFLSACLAHFFKICVQIFFFIFIKYNIKAQQFFLFFFFFFYKKKVGSGISHTKA